MRLSNVNNAMAKRLLKKKKLLKLKSTKEALMLISMFSMENQMRHLA
jgi:hypothetical protein